jgi:hypothetical protein
MPAQTVILQFWCGFFDGGIECLTVVRPARHRGATMRLANRMASCLQVRITESSLRSRQAAMTLN